MRWIVYVVIAALSACTQNLTVAGPLPVSQPIPLPQMDAFAYSMQLQEVSALIEERYVKAIPRARLIEAGLRGLYGAARQPFPAGLPKMVDEVIDNPTRLRSLLVIARLQLGNLQSLRDNRAIQISLQSMLSLLDPFCQLVLDGREERKVGGAERFGLEFVDPIGSPPFIVKSVTLGSPAQKSGIRPGDQIMQCNGTRVEDGIDKWLQEFRSDRVRLTINRPGTKRFSSTVVYAEPIEHECVLGVSRNTDNSWEYFTDQNSGIAHVRLSDFGLNSSDELKRILSLLQKRGLRGLLLDLRWCPGGYLEESRQVADLFLGDYQIQLYVHPVPGNFLALADDFLNHRRSNAVVHYRDGHEDERFLGPPEVGVVGIPMVVLVNGETSGGAELIAAVLQDNQRAWVAGERTRGKASVQTDLYLDGQQLRTQLSMRVPNTRLKLTCGMLTRPSGRNLNRFPESGLHDDWGVMPAPALEFRTSPAASRQLRDWWQLQSLRPGSCEEALPLDDPRNDPQREYALQFLGQLCHRSK